MNQHDSFPTIGQLHARLRAGETTREQWLRQGEYIKQALSQIGIDLTLRSEDTATWLRDQNARHHA